MRIRKMFVGVSIIISFVIVYIISLFMKLSPTAQPYLPPSPQYLLGTTWSGESMLVYDLRASGVSLMFAILAPLFSTLIGLGLLMSIFNSFIDNAVNEITIFFISIPKYPLFLILSFVLPPNNYVTLGVMVLVLWTLPVRILRPIFKQHLNSNYVISYFMLGANNLYILRKIIRKNINIIFSQFCTNAIVAISMQAGLAFLGIGNVSVPSWGYLIRVAIDTPRVIYTNAWIWWILPPLAFLILLDMSFLLIILDLERNYNISTLSAKLLRAFW
ncbi:hypothetical protein BFU36_00440 [Sulfolobus sp. A20]|uniref:ABC transporter permease subunit n=2 Tax=Sulfolobaceae TaxID=118883 RepID=UPI000845BF50|nr:ABC transporter permease subunit [Sulfolobus sp. A20]AOL17566.1 hypothetical protein BFU36_00440 [Sulfolobus sp. A20]TRN02412.1 ABC transporter permease [Sulfolobus sp. E1]